jgi:gas vesicle protein
MDTIVVEEPISDDEGMFNEETSERPPWMMPAPKPKAITELERRLEAMDERYEQMQETLSAERDAAVAREQAFNERHEASTTAMADQMDKLHGLIVNMQEDSKRRLDSLENRFEKSQEAALAAQKLAQ